MKKTNRSNYKVTKGTAYKGKSLTIQDDSLSIAQLLQKHISGANVREKEGVYVDDPDHEDVDGEKFWQMDIADQEDVRAGIRAMRARLEALEKELSEEEKERLKLAKIEKSKGVQDEA